MKVFKVEDYKEALSGAGPKTTENILRRAIGDTNISFEQLVVLEDYADQQTKKRGRRI